jgi:hypothetical protein
MRVEGNRIGGKNDATEGWAITTSASSAGCWLDGNQAGSGDAEPDTEGYVDSASDEINFWGRNYTGTTAEAPATD